MKQGEKMRMGIRVAFATLALVWGSQLASAQSKRVVALVVSVGDNTTRADAIQTQLEIMGAETLRADEPNNAQLRSIVTRFAREAADSRATFVYIDAPAVNFEGRTFVLPRDATLKNPTDLFTQGIAIQAFARSAAQAEQGGAVAMTVTALGGDLPDALSVTERAPEAVPGSGAVLVASADTFGTLLAALEGASTQEEIELGAILRELSGKGGITVSEVPRTPILLRIAARSPVSDQPDPASTPSIALPEAPATPATTGTTDEGAVEPEDILAELALLEQSMSRAAKRSVQQKLRDLGHYNGLVDGIFGPQTRDAIKAFQTSRSEETTGFLNRRQQLDLIS